MESIRNWYRSMSGGAAIEYFYKANPENLTYGEFLASTADNAIYRADAFHHVFTSAYLTLDLYTKNIPLIFICSCEWHCFSTGNEFLQREGE